MTTETTGLPGLDEIHTRFEAAFNSKDLERIVALYEPHALFVTIFGTVARGHAEIRDAYRPILAENIRITLTTAGIYRNAELALMHAEWVLRETGPDGQQIERRGTSAEVARLQPNGSWLYALDNPTTPFER